MPHQSSHTAIVQMAKYAHQHVHRTEKDPGGQLLGSYLERYSLATAIKSKGLGRMYNPYSVTPQLIAIVNSINLTSSDSPPAVMTHHDKAWGDSSHSSEQLEENTNTNMALRSSTQRALVGIHEYVHCTYLSGLAETT